MEEEYYNDPHAQSVARLRPTRYHSDPYVHSVARWMPPNYHSDPYAQSVARLRPIPRSRDEEEYDRSKIIAIIVSTLCLCLGLILLVLFLTPAGDEEEEDLSHSATYLTNPGPTGGAKTVITMPTGPQNLTVTPTTTTTTTTTTKRPIIQELLCSINQVAVVPWKYPPDGMCTYIYYSELIVTKNEQQQYELHDAVGDPSWKMFKKEMKKRTRTEGGAAFDARYITVEGINGIQNVLVGLAQENIPHYGVLNVLAEASDLKPLLDNTTEVMQELKNLQGGNVKRRTVIAIGLYDYGAQDAWDTYRILFKQAVDTIKADTVIAISSTGFRQSPAKCRAAPPTATTSPYDSFPSLQHHGELVKPSFQYNNPGAVVGLSMEMATLTYTLDQGAPNPDQIAYAKCTSSGFTSAEIICPSDKRMSKVINSSYQAGFIAPDKFVFLADTVSTMAEKVAFLKNLPPRRNFSILLFNVHRVDKTKRCIPEFFDRIARVKEDFYLN